MARVIAYGMQDSELAAAAQLLKNSERTDSFVIGDIDADKLDELRSAGLIVAPISSDEQPETPGGGAKLTPTSQPRTTSYSTRSIPSLAE